MARVTVEDCIEKIPNRFELVLMAAQRARDITAGSPLTVDKDNDKNPVIALREIADSTTDLDQVQDDLIKGLQKHVETDEPAEDAFDALAAQHQIAAEIGEPANEAEEVAADGLTIHGDGGEVEDTTAEQAVTVDEADMDGASLLDES